MHALHSIDQFNEIPLHNTMIENIVNILIHGQSVYVVGAILNVSIYLILYKSV